MNQEFEILEVDHYNAVQLQRYDNVWGILSLQKGGGNEGSWYKKWVFKSKWSNGVSVATDKKMPVAVRLGDREEAIKTLEALLSQVKGE